MLEEEEPPLKISSPTPRKPLPKLPFIVVIDGPIAAGKSTIIEELIREFDGKDGISFLREPSREWRSLLTSLYKGKDVGFELQLLVLATFFIKIQNIIKQESPKVLVCDRYIDSAVEAFAPTMVNYGSLTKEKVEILDEVASTYQAHLNLRTPFRFFLTGPVETFYENMKHRNRPIDSTLTEPFLKDLGNQYIMWRKRMPKHTYQVLPAARGWSKDVIADHIDQLLECVAYGQGPQKKSYHFK